MGAWLQIRPKNEPEFDVSLENTTTIGRTRENTVSLHFSPQVSRQHAVIRCQDGGRYQLIDLGSRNGTYVNDQRVVIPVALADDARIRIAENILVFRREEAGTLSGADQSGVTMLPTQSSTYFGAVEVERSVALLVADLRGFSTMSERVASGDLAQFLGAWFRESGNLVAARGGTIDKFIGDSLLAYFDFSRTTVGCSAALEAARGLQTLAGTRRWPTGERVHLAVALHFGSVTMSNVGLAAARDATIVGDAVNAVFRMEVLCKELAQHTILSSQIVDHLEPGTPFVDLGVHSLRGKAQKIHVLGLPV